MSGQIFISYRREESSAWAGRLSDRLSNHFPSNQIFMDVDSIDLGEDFAKAIEKTVGSCDVLIAVIGKGWLSSCDQEGQRRLDNPDDFVRIEIATALKREIRVIPVLVEGASMPRSRDLPDDLKALVRRNALQLSHDRFRTDSERLASAVERALEKTAAERKQREETQRLETERLEKERLEAEQRQREPGKRNNRSGLETERRETLLAGPVIVDVNTDRARYAPGATVTVYVDLKNTTGATITNGTVTVSCKHLDTLLTTLQPQTFTLANGASTTLTFSWTPPTTDFRGYAVEAWARTSSGGYLDNLNSAVDVSSTWTKFPRYGYLSTYPQQSAGTSYNSVWKMKNYHINGIQYYDWQWKHHVPLAGTVANPEPSWVELAKRTVYRQTVLDMIQASHDYNISAMNYNLMYGAWAGYGEDSNGVDWHWGLFNDPGHTSQYLVKMPDGWASPYLFFFDPSNTSWQNYIFNREANVFAAYPFDGWHVDIVGDPGSLKYNAYGGTVDVWTTFRGFLNNAKARLSKTIFFNNVGGFGLYDVAHNSNVDAVYVECWPGSGQNTYNDLKTMIDNSISWSNGKGVVIPAYMDYVYAQNNPGRNFNTPGVLLTDATIMASGASHLELGDGTYMLDHEYFPNKNLTPSAALLATLRNYYDFDVAYQNLLRGNFANSSNAIVLGVPSSNNGTANKVWAFAKRNGNVAGSIHMLNFINLMGLWSNNWRDDCANYPVPTLQSNVSVKYYFNVGSLDVTSLYWASPDINNGKSYSLPYTAGTDAGGTYVQFTLPSLAYWDMVYMTLGSGNGS